MPIVQTIKIYRGEDITLHFTMEPVVDITDWTISMTVAKNYNTAVKVFTVAGALVNAILGEFDVDIPKAVTDTLEPETYVYDVWRTDSGFERILSVGSFIVGADARVPV